MHPTNSAITSSIPTHYGFLDRCLCEIRVQRLRVKVQSRHTKWCPTFRSPTRSNLFSYHRSGNRVGDPPWCLGHKKPVIIRFRPVRLAGQTPIRYPKKLPNKGRGGGLPTIAEGYMTIHPGPYYYSLEVPPSVACIVAYCHHVQPRDC
jgi:hypothetical protein